MKKIFNVFVALLFSVSCFAQVDCCEAVNKSGFWFQQSSINSTQMSVELYVDGELIDQVSNTYNDYFVTIDDVAQYTLVITSNSPNTNYQSCMFTGESCIAVIGSECCYAFGFGDNPKVAKLPNGKVVSAECSDVLPTCECSEPLVSGFEIESGCNLPVCEPLITGFEISEGCAFLPKIIEPGFDFDFRN